MSVLERQAERIKLEKLLGEEDGSLAFMEKLPAPALEAFRERVLATLFDSHGGMFERLAGSGKLLPPKLSAVVAEKALGPMLCGRVAGHTPVDRAVALAERLSVRFMADVSTHLDPRRVQPLLRGISEKHIRAVARELASRNDVITMGRFIDALPVETTERVMEDLRDDGLLLRVAFFAGDKRHLSRVVRLLPEGHLRRIIAAAREQGLWNEALALMHFVETDLSRYLGDLAADEAGFFDGMLEAVQARGMWPDMLFVVGEMSEESRRRMLASPVLEDEPVLRGLAGAAGEAGLREPLLALAGDFPPDTRERLLALLGQKGADAPVA